LEVNFDVVMETDEHSVDMKTGLDTLQGFSDTIRYIGETILTEHTPQRLTHKGKVRTTLKQSFKGSYGHVFSMNVYDPLLEGELRKIGREAFCELVSYFLAESLYLESRPLSVRAQSILDRLGNSAEHLIGQLRISTLDKIHEVPTKFDHDVKIRYRKSRDDQTTLAVFNRNTAEVLLAEESDEIVDITVGITRLNINTGNGRLLIKGETETVAFGFGVEYKAVRFEAKKKFSANLDHNNGLDNRKWLHLRVRATPIKLKDGKVIKYHIRSIIND